MNTKSRIGALLSGAAVLAGVAGLSVGPAPVSAAPGQSGATLFVIQDPAHTNNYRLAILGTYPMQQADAVGFINNINNGKCQGGMFYYIYGDDGDPQHIYTHYLPGAAVDGEGYLEATSEGLQYRREIALRKNFLNEDGDGEDEIYAQANFLDSDCNTRLQTTQVIRNSF
jgi:hypothetical protein